jgi:hypothetical protein
MLASYSWGNYIRHKINNVFASIFFSFLGSEICRLVGLKSPILLSGENYSSLKVMMYDFAVTLKHAIW